MAQLIPAGPDAQYYANGRGVARYQGQRPLAADPTLGTAVWWSNEGVKDVWAGLPSRTGIETIWRDGGGAERPVIGGTAAAANPWTPPPQAGRSLTPANPAPAAPAAGGGVYVPPPNSGNPPAPRGGPNIPIRQAPGYNSNLPPGPAQVDPGNTRFFEVCARSPLGRMLYDTAVSFERQQGDSLVLNLVKGLITFDVLGADPGDYTAGYRLSGPDGPIAQRVGRLMGLRTLKTSPSAYGLDGWYGAKTSRGIRILGKGELQALGLI